MRQTKTTTVYKACPECSGTGRKDLFGYEREVQLCCFLCGGSGKVIESLMIEETVVYEDTH